MQASQCSYQTGPSLERVPDDILNEVLSHLPTLKRCHFPGPRFVDVRRSVLHALSQTSRLLRSRFLAMAWQSVDFCRAFIPEEASVLFSLIGGAIERRTRVLLACTHLLPLIRVVTVILVRYHSDEIIPAFAACLAVLPNLDTIQVKHAPSQMTGAIKNGFKDRRFPSIRRISLPSSAHEIIKSCPNLEEVRCIHGDGSTIIGSLVKGKCRGVRVLKGISAPLTRLVGALPDLNHIDVMMKKNMKGLTDFPNLDTIEIVVPFMEKHPQPLREIADQDVKEASRILRESKSQTKKTVVVTSGNAEWNTFRFEFDAERRHAIREVIKV